MQLTRHATSTGPRWAFEGQYLSPNLDLTELLPLPREELMAQLGSVASGPEATDPVIAPVEPHMEVWAAGVTYLRSRDAREAESSVRDVYQRVYEADRPELFFKANGWRVCGHGEKLRLRRDSTWDVPEPELTLVINSHAEVIGYTAGNDLSSRSIEGENPLYLPQAKCFEGSCALGHGICLSPMESLSGLSIRLSIQRDAETVFSGETDTSMMKRSFDDLVKYLFREMRFPHGVMLMTGTGIVPDETFTLQPGDRVQVEVGSVNLCNEIAPEETIPA